MDERSAAERAAATATRLQELEAQVATLEHERDTDARGAQLDALQMQLRRIEESVVWRTFQSLRTRFYGPGGEDSRRARAISAALRGASSATAKARGIEPPERSREPAPAPPGATPPIADVPFFAEPEVSLILPVYSQPELTAQCVRAIVATATVPYELIIVDDTSSTAVKEVVARISGATVVVNEQNLGYAMSLNRGAAVARGRHLLFLNDDIIPQDRWLEAMVDCMESSDAVGVVVPMYLDPSWQLKEAGAIVWRDGTADHFGRGDCDLNRSRYRFRRDVDYGSGACLLMRAELFHAVGGVDERFAPAYYEDVDLCFAAREHGCRVVYEPRARIVHIEGATGGTDTSAGVKRYQTINHAVFVDKWQHRLAAQPHRGGDQRTASRHGSQPHVLIADERVPSPDRDGGSRRIAAIIDAYVTMGCAVTFLPANGQGTEPYTSQLEAAGVEVLQSAQDADTELPLLGQVLTLAILSRPFVASQLVYRLRTVAPAARIVYDTVDLHFVRELRRLEFEGVAAASTIDAMREIELALVRSSDITLVVTGEEREEVLRSVPSADVRVIATVETTRPNLRPPHDRAGVVFVGNFLHVPNIDAARYLVDSVMPHVWRELGDVPVTIVGQDPPPYVQTLAGPRVEIAGWVEHLGPVLDDARVAVAPLRYGAGLKLKTVEAMAQGLPVVTTSVGAEGMATGGPHLLIADDSQAFAAHIVALLRDDALWTQTSDAGIAFVEQHYAPGIITPQLRELLPAAGAPARRPGNPVAADRATKRTQP